MQEVYVLDTNFYSFNRLMKFLRATSNTSLLLLVVDLLRQQASDGALMILEAAFGLFCVSCGGLEGVSCQADR